MSLPLHRPIQRAYYSVSVREFLQTPAAACLGILSQQNRRFFSTQEAQSTYAWEVQIALLQAQLQQVAGLCQNIYFEFSIPRVGRRVDVLLLLHHHIVLLEFKVSASSFSAQARDQVWDYALDLHHFHATSQGHALVPVLVCTDASVQPIEHAAGPDGIHAPLCIAGSQIAQALTSIAATKKSSAGPLESAAWEAGTYQPSPSILEAALALYQGHQVQDISRSDASGMSLQATTQTLRRIIHNANQQQQKAICFVTGVPGAGKTLVGLNLANGSDAEQNAERCVYLSGNGPLVDILREALAGDLAQRQKVRKEQARQRVNTFIQNIHHFRDECLRDLSPPHEHVAIFDEAQRAWNTQQTSKFMQNKKGYKDFTQSEPEFLISCLDRHPDWAVVVCLVGGGQEINTGEAGITAWIEAVAEHFPSWQVYIAPELYAKEYGGQLLANALQRLPLPYVGDSNLHLKMSMRSFRANNVAAWVHAVLELDSQAACEHWQSLRHRFPLVMTRDLSLAKQWLRQKSRGNERYGLLASSQAQRLKPLGIHVKAPLDPVHWFLKDKTDVRSAFAMEDAATEFHVQGLELDWSCVVWDADLRLSPEKVWQHYSFKGNRWMSIKQPTEQSFLLNAYRVLLTRARQGMVIVIPHGDAVDPTRTPAFYDGVYTFFKQLGISELQ